MNDEVVRKLTHEEIIDRQQSSQKGRLPFSVIINNIRSLYNVGSIFRTADGAGVDKIWICGYTGCPPNKQISKTALGAEDSVPWEHHDNIQTLLTELKEKGTEIVILEQMNNSKCYTTFKPKTSVCLVLGNEVEGVAEEVISYCDTALEIEMAGLKNSLNVSVAFGIIAYHIRQSLLK